MKNDFIKNNKFELLVGINDQNTHKEEFAVDDIIKIIAQYFIEKEAGFSIIPQKGATHYADGKMFVENGFNITIIGVIKEDMMELQKNIKSMLNQETVILSENEIEVMYI